MKIKLTLAILLALVLCLPTGCQDVYQPSYTKINAELEKAQEKIAEQEAKLAKLEAALEQEQATANETRKEVKAYQDKITKLEEALKTPQTETDVTEKNPPPTPEPTPLQEVDINYVETIDYFSSIRVAVLNATWDDAKSTVTVSLALKNTCYHKIRLNLLAVQARDQWWNKGAFAGQRVQFVEWGEEGYRYEEEPVAICPDLQKEEKAWPGQTIPLDVTWRIGPRSEVITIEFVVVFTPVREDDVPIEVGETYPILKPVLTVSRPQISTEP